MTAPIAFLSDFGLQDGYVGVVKGVILSINPAVPVVDLSHAVPPQDVRAAAYLLMTAVQYFPSGTIFLSVVDPGVGTTRAAVAVEAAGYRFVGPDNGLMGWALGRLARDEGLKVELAGETLQLGRHLPMVRPTAGADPAAVTAVALTAAEYWRTTVSATFHGRDIFGPVAAHLSLGVPLERLGEPVTSLRGLTFPMPAATRDGLRGEVVYVDRFGNLVTSLSAVDAPIDAVIQIAGRSIVGLSPHYQRSSDLIALVGSSGLVEVSVPNGSAADLLSVGVGAPVLVTHGDPSTP